jgi:hypothetical protein
MKQTPFLWLVKQWPGMPELWRGRNPETLCKRGILCTSRYWTQMLIDGFCSHHCRLESKEGGEEIVQPPEKASSN